MSSGITVVGVDPGLNGALAVIRDGRVILAERTPTWSWRDGGRERRCVDGPALMTLIDSVGVPIAAAYLENCYGRRNDQAGPQSAFGFGGAFWVLMDRLRGSATITRVVAIQPRTWQRSILKVRGKVDRDSTKSASIAFTRAFHPEVDLAPGLLRTPHDGIADAVGIAHFGWLQETSPLAGLVAASPPRTVRRPARGRARY